VKRPFGQGNAAKGCLDEKIDSDREWSKDAMYG
jgi:hypothetical protein